MKGCIAGALGVLWVVSPALATDSGASPYAGIVDRNVFALKPPPPPPRPEDNKPPPPKITLQGITTLLGKKLVLMKVMVPGSKPGAKSEEVPLTLTVGQKQEDVEVLEIHEDEPKWVKVNNSGTITNLNFKDNGVNLASAAAPAGPPRPGVGVPPPPTGTPPAYPSYHPPASPYQHSVPHTRPMNSAGGSTYNPAVAAPNVYTAMPTSPGINTAGTPTTSTPGPVALNGLGAPASQITKSQNWPPETPMTPEQAAIMEAAYTMKYQKEIQAGSMPSIPGSNPILDSGNTPAPQNSQSRF